MANLIKYSTGATPAGCIRKGDMLITVAQLDYGSTFYSSINPPDGGYTIYLNKASQGPSIYCPENDTILIKRTNEIAGTAYTTVAECLTYFAGEADKLIVNSGYTELVTNGLVLNLNADMIASYPGAGASWYDLSGNNTTNTLYNGPAFNTNGYITFDGTNDYGVNTNTALNLTGNVTVITWIKESSLGAAVGNYMSKGSNQGYRIRRNGTSGSNLWLYSDGNSVAGGAINDDIWYMITAVFSSTGLRAYINGTLVASNSSPYAPSAVGGASFIIGGFSTTQELFGGSMASLQVYSTALTQAEILQNYYHGPIVTDSLVFAVDASNLVSYENGTTVTRSLVDLTTGTLLNGTGYSADGGGSWSFDGSNDFTGFVDNTALNSQTITMESWSKVPTFSQDGFLFEKGQVNTQYSNFYNSDGTFYFRTVGLNIWDLTITPSSYASVNQWNHIVCTYGAGVKRIYVNGVKVAEQTGLTGTISTNTAGLFIGAYGAGFGYFINGKIALSRVYTKALSPEEVGKNFNAQRARFGR
jgi:hypothetical protein